MKLLCRNACLFFILTVILSVFSAGVVAAEPAVTASSAVVMDCDTGAFYYTKDADTMRIPASMTKLMAAYIIFEELDKGTISKDSLVTISTAAANLSSDSSYSNVPLCQGEQYSVDTMLKAMLVPSACGASYAMAEYISGSEAAFVTRMNTTAAALGMNANFIDCHGVNSDYVTARSVAILSYHLIQRYPDVLNYTSLKSITFKGTTYKNTNELLSTNYYAGVDGLKTGTTSAAGYCLVATAKQNGRRILTVVMHSTSSAKRYDDSKKLLDYGFSQVKTSDAASSAASFTLSSTTAQIRRGADFTVNATISNATTSFIAAGGWTVNGVTVATFNATMKNGTVLSNRFNLDAYAGNDVTIGFYINLPNGTKKTESTYTFNTQTPCAFRDINGHWAESAITELKTLGSLSGYSDGSFRPDNSITRAEFVTALIRTMAAKGLLTVTDGTCAFSDVQGKWSEKYVAAAVSNGIIVGYEDGTFRPDQNITRQEIAVVICMAFHFTSAGNTASSFGDDAAIADWAKTWVCAAAENGVIAGYPDHTFQPNNNATRAESAVLLMRAASVALPAGA